MPLEKFNGITPEQYFLQSKQVQANYGHGCLEWDYRLAFIENFGFTEGWAYELMKKLIKKYEGLGQLTVRKVDYWDGNDKHWRDREFIWKPELLPPPSKEKPP